MLINFEFKNEISRIAESIETDKSFEDLVTDIWASEIVTIIGKSKRSNSVGPDATVSFRVNDLLWIEERNI